MKSSCYNATLRTDKGEIFLVNPLYNIIARLEPWLYELWEENQNNVSFFKEHHPNFYDYLKAKNFIIPDQIDEVEKCILKVQQNYDYNNGCLHLTINPTMDCNLRCWYCYEEHRKGSFMTNEIKESIISYVYQSLNKNKWTSVHLSFFGGEPLLGYREVIIPILVSVKEICNNFGLSFSHSYTTNGTLLTEKRVNELKDISSNLHFQIPFDGDEGLHNQTKHFGNGRGSYKKTLAAVRYLIKQRVNVSLRLNATNQNIYAFKELVKAVSDLKEYKNFNIQVQKVWQEKETEDLKRGIKEIAEFVKQLGITSNLENNGYRRVRCYADFHNNLVINYDGNVYQCTARDFTEENSLGKLQPNGTIIFNERYYQRKQSLIKGECHSCRLLPICPMCSQRRFETKQRCPYNNSEQALQENLIGYFELKK